MLHFETNVPLLNMAKYMIFLKYPALYREFIGWALSGHSCAENYTVSAVSLFMLDFIS